MRKIIDGKLYDTENAEHLADISLPGFNRSDFRWEDTGLYRSPKGTFFIAGEGGALSRWAVPEGQSGHGPGEGLLVIPEDEARYLVEKHCSTKLYVEIFGEPEEG